MRTSELFNHKTVRSIAGLALLVSLAYATTGTSAPSSQLAEAHAETSVTLDEPTGTVQPSATPGEIEDPSGCALAGFFRALDDAKTGRKRAVVSYYGDSPITNDDITSTIRNRLQARFGDGGHGFVLAGKPWGWYAQKGVEIDGDRGWQSERMFITRGDRHFGLGGVRFGAASAGQSVTFETAPQSPATAFEVYYLAQPGGGDLAVSVDGTALETFSTWAPQPTSGFRRIEVDEGHHALTLETRGNGPVTLYGVALERGAAGVSLDSLGVNGAYVGLLAHYMDEQHWIEQLRHRAPDLVVLAYGANESEYEKLPMDRYDDDMREVVRRIRTALPTASILFVGPMDRGTRGPGGAIVSRPMIARLTEHQRRIAAETGCAFFDTQTAMGGEGTVARWYAARPRLMGGDLTHPTAQGAEIVGTLVADAIERGYER